MRQPAAGTAVFEEKSVWKVLMKIAPPVMLAQLIQALYNIVDSFFVGKYSGDGLTALSIIFPVQLVITAIAVGTGVGVNTQMSRQYARGEKVEETAGTGTALALISWAAFALKPLNMLFNMEPLCAWAASVSFWRASGPRGIRLRETCGGPCWRRWLVR